MKCVSFKILWVLLLIMGCNYIDTQTYDLRNSHNQSKAIQITQYEKVRDGVRVEALVPLDVSTLEIQQIPTPDDCLEKIMLQAKSQLNDYEPLTKKWFFISQEQLNLAGIKTNDFIIINSLVK